MCHMGNNLAKQSRENDKKINQEPMANQPTLKPIGLLLLAILFPVISYAQDLPSAIQNKYVVTVPKLNVRKAPSSKSAIIGGLSKGDIVTVRDLKKSWAEIDFKKGIGYVSTSYIQPVEEEKTREEEYEEIVTDTASTQNNKITDSDKQRSRKWFSRTFNQFHFRLSSTLSLGLSNFHSFDAYSYPRFGFGLDVGSQIRADFLPKHVFSEVSMGFMYLGNSNYSFPSFSINVLPAGYRSDSFNFWKFRNIRYYGIGGLSFQFSGGGIRFYRNSNYYSFSSKPTINLYLKGGIEIKDMIGVGFLYMHGFNNVCSGLPIGIKHSVFQLYGSFLFDRWKKK